MSKLMILYLLSAILLVSCHKSNDNNTNNENTVTVSMEANSTNDVYYSFANGVAGSVLRADWDIAFSVPLQTATILINEGAGVELYCVGDTNIWNNADTANLQTRGPRFNNKSDWSVGAFNLYATGGFNFGWGTYNLNVHNVYGDSIYIIKLSDGTFKKLFIRNRIGIPDTYILRWANIDGSSQIDTSFSCAPYYNKKNFIQYSIVNKKVVVAEPDMNNWDLLFTRYIVKLPTGPATTINYPVTGVLINPLEQGLKVTGVTPENANYTDTSATFTSQTDIIGWEWKINDPTTHLYSIAPNTSYFVKLSGGIIYRIYFTNFVSSADGKITFKTKKVE
jgi:hypothetical protein